MRGLMGMNLYQNLKKIIHSEHYDCVKFSKTKTSSISYTQNLNTIRVSEQKKTDITSRLLFEAYNFRHIHEMITRNKNPFRLELMSNRPEDLRYFVIPEEVYNFLYTLYSLHSSYNAFFKRFFSLTMAKRDRVDLSRKLFLIVSDDYSEIVGFSLRYDVSFIKESLLAHNKPLMRISDVIDYDIATNTLRSLSFSKATSFDSYYNYFLEETQSCSKMLHTEMVNLVNDLAQYIDGPTRPNGEE